MSSPNNERQTQSLDESQQMNIIVENLPTHVDDKILKLIMCGYGEIQNAEVQVKRDQTTNENKCHGFVQFRTSEAAKKAIRSLHGNDIAGSPLRVRVVFPVVRSVNLCVRNLPQNFENEDLYVLFSPFGEISSPTIVTDDNGHCRGIGFVGFATYSCAETAIRHLNGTRPTTEFDQNIIVEFAEDTYVTERQQEVYNRPGDVVNDINPPASPQPSPLPPQRTPNPGDDTRSLGIMPVTAGGNVPVAALHLSGVQVPNLSSSPCFSDLQSPLSPLSSLSSNSSRSSLGSLDSLGMQSATSASITAMSGGDQTAGLQLQIPSTSEIDLSNVYIHGFPKSWDDSDLITSFHSFGKIVSVRVMRTKNGESRGIGFVRFESAEEAQKAIMHVNGTEVDGKPLTCRIANAKNLSAVVTPVVGDLQTPTTIQAHGITSGIDPTNVYVHGFPKTWQDSDLIKKFAPFGVIVSTRVMRDKTTGESRSIGFVKFTSAEEASRAIKEIHSTMEDGKVLVCRIANAGSIGKSPCKYFKEGRCNKGSNCTFSHDVTVVSPASPVPTAQTPSHIRESLVLKEEQLPQPATAYSLYSTPQPEGGVTPGAMTSSQQTAQSLQAALSSTPRATSGNVSTAVAAAARQRSEVHSPPIMTHVPSIQSVQAPLPQSQPSMQQTTALSSTARHGGGTLPSQAASAAGTGVSVLGHAFGNTFVDIPPRGLGIQRMRSLPQEVTRPEISRQQSLQEVSRQPQALQSQDFSRSTSLQVQEQHYKDRLAREELAHHLDISRQQQSLAAARRQEFATRQELTRQELARHDLTTLQQRGGIPRDLPRQHFSRDMAREHELPRDFSRDMQELRLHPQDSQFGRMTAAVAGAASQAAPSPHQSLGRQGGASPGAGGTDLQELLLLRGGPGPKLDYTADKYEKYEQFDYDKFDKFKPRRNQRGEYDKLGDEDFFIGNRLGHPPPPSMLQAMDGPPLGAQSPQLGGNGGTLGLQTAGRGLLGQTSGLGGTPTSRDRLNHLKYTTTDPSSKNVASMFDKSYPKKLRVHLTQDNNLW